MSPLPTNHLALTNALVLKVLGLRALLGMGSAYRGDYLLNGSISSKTQPLTVEHLSSFQRSSQGPPLSPAVILMAGAFQSLVSFWRLCLSYTFPSCSLCLSYSSDYISTYRPWQTGPAILSLYCYKRTYGFCEDADFLPPLCPSVLST